MQARARKQAMRSPTWHTPQGEQKQCTMQSEQGSSGRPNFSRMRRRMLPANMQLCSQVWERELMWIVEAYRGLRPRECEGGLCSMVIVQCAEHVCVCVCVCVCV